MQKILIVDDDERIRRLVERYLKRDGFEVREAGSAHDMWVVFEQFAPNLVLLDLGLPDSDGLDLARAIRRVSEVPIIMLTGKDTVIDRVVGLEMGADDYVTKPFDERELLARIRTILRRVPAEEKRVTGPQSTTDDAVQFDGWTLDRNAIELTNPVGETIPLTSYEFRLLELFVTRPQRTLSRDQLLELLAERDWSPYDRSIDVMIGKLRKKIETDPKNPRFIKTIRGIGYKFAGKIAPPDSTALDLKR